MKLYNPKYHDTLKAFRRAKKKKVPFWIEEYIELTTLQSLSLKGQHSTSISLYKNQKSAFDELVCCSSALLEAPTSFGKTVVMAALHDAIGGKTMIAIHNNSMIEQVSKEFQKFLNITPSQFCGGKKDATGDVVIVSYNALRDVPNLTNNVTTLIIDEADQFFSDKAIQVLLHAGVKRIYGMTGTSKTRFDVCNTIAEGVLGVFYGKKIIKDSDKVNPLKQIFYRKHESNFFDEKGNKILPASWYLFREHLDTNIERKIAQMEYLFENTDGEEQVLVLLDRVYDVDAWYNALEKRGKRVFKQHGEMHMRDRKKHLEDFAKVGGYLIGQTKTLERGYSNTKLVKAFVFFPINAKGRGENTLRQIIGRIMRHFEDKESYIYLWRDSSLEFQWKNVYKTLQVFFPSIDISSS